MSDNINIKKTSLAWLDDSPNDAQDNIVAQQQFRLLDNNFKMLKNKNDLDEYIKSQSPDTRITLIVNGRLGQETVPNIHTSTQIIAIYVYCMNKELHEKWAKNFTKIKGVYTDLNDLRKALGPSHTSKTHSIISEMPTTDSSEVATAQLPIISEMPTTYSSEVTTTQLPITYEMDGLYMISDSCLDYLVRMKTLPKEKDDFVTLCQEAHQENNELLAIIREFQENYSADRAISWLNREPFFLRFIDVIFTTGSIDAMFSCRAFIRDIQKQLEQHKCTSTIQVYRTEIMSDEQLQRLKSFNGKIIAIKSFFMTNLDRDTVLSYTSGYSSNNENKCILFTIEANPQIENVKPFAKIGSLSNNNDQNDVLFMIGSLFKITEIQDEKDGIINIKMTLCANDDTNKTRELFDQIKYQYIDEKGETDVIGFGQFLCDIGSSIRDSNISNCGKNYIRSYLDKLPNDHPDRPRCYDALGKFDLSNHDLDSSLDWYKKSFDMRKEKLGANDQNLVESYTNLAIVYLQKGDFTEALEYFKPLSQIWKQSYGDDCFNLIFCYTNMAMIYEQQDNLTEAISYYYQALAIMIKHQSTNEVSFAVLYHNLGNAHAGLKNYHIALGYFNTSLEMKLRIHTAQNLSIATTYRSIGLVYGYMNNVQQSRENLEKAAVIYRELCSPDNPNVTDIEELIRNLPNTNQS